MTQQPADSTVLPRQVPGAHIADPAPLGLAGFALTTFLLGAVNSGWFQAEPVVFGLALAYGGTAQFAAGLWEFAKGNTFGATAFCSYGGFWVSFWWLTAHADSYKLPAGELDKGIAWYLLAWGIFTAYMMVAALRVNAAVLTVFVLLTVAFFVLAWGSFATGSPNITKVGGYITVATAVAAWYTSFAGVTKFTFGRDVLPNRTLG